MENIFVDCIQYDCIQIKPSKGQVPVIFCMEEDESITGQTLADPWSSPFCRDKRELTKIKKMRCRRTNVLKKFYIIYFRFRFGLVNAINTYQRLKSHVVGNFSEIFKIVKKTYFGLGTK